jgi:hypothetical protein
MEGVFGDGRKAAVCGSPASWRADGGTLKSQNVAQVAFVARAHFSDKNKLMSETYIIFRTSEELKTSQARYQRRGSKGPPSRGQAEHRTRFDARGAELREGESGSHRIPHRTHGNLRSLAAPLASLRLAPARFMPPPSTTISTTTAIMPSLLPSSSWPWPSWSSCSSSRGAM